MSESQLERQISKFGEIVKIGIDRFRCCAMVQYDSMETAKEALNSIKGTYIGSSTIPCMVSVVFMLVPVYCVARHIGHIEDSWIEKKTYTVYGADKEAILSVGMASWIAIGAGIWRIGC